MNTVINAIPLAVGVGVKGGQVAPFGVGVRGDGDKGGQLPPSNDDSKYKYKIGNLLEYKEDVVIGLCLSLNPTSEVSNIICMYITYGEIMLNFDDDNDDNDGYLKMVDTNYATEYINNKINLVSNYDINYEHNEIVSYELCDLVFDLKKNSVKYFTEIKTKLKKYYNNTNRIFKLKNILLEYLNTLLNIITNDIIYYEYNC